MVNPTRLIFTMKTWASGVNQINMTEGKYLYCIIKENKPKKFCVKGIEGKDVYNVCDGGISAVVSDSEVKEYFISRENLLAHQMVLEEISQQYNALPVSFGTVSENSEELKQNILRPRAKDFEGQLKKVEGKIELGLKALWTNMPAVFQEIAKSSPMIQNLKKSKNTSYQQKISAGELVGHLLEEKREEEKEKILKPLEKIADDVKENKVLGGDMIVNVAFLVQKTKEKEFDKQVNSLGEKFGQRVKFAYVGPLPPFNFVELHLTV